MAPDRALSRASITALHPLRAVEGGRVTILGKGFAFDPLPEVSFDGVPARVSFASSNRLTVITPSEHEGGPAAVKVSGAAGETAFMSIGSIWATGLHQVDSPVFDANGDLFVTYSGSRGQEAAVSVFRVTQAGARESFGSGIVNATSMVFGPDGLLYVSSRFEGAVYRLDAAGVHEKVASDLGVACGLAFDAEGRLYVGDRSGTIFRVMDGDATVFATLPPSIAAFHLAMSPEQELFVTAPTLNPYDHIYRVDRDGQISTIPSPLGRPQGLAFAPDGSLHVVEALAGASGVYRFSRFDAAPELVVSAATLVGVAFSPRGEMVVASNDKAYRFE